MGDGIARDLFEQAEPEVILKMNSMMLPDLLNLMWSVQEINRGSNYFFEKLEGEIVTRLRAVKDEDVQLLIECFADDSDQSIRHKFSDRFMDLLVKVIREKKDLFQIRTLTHIVWSLAKSVTLSRNHSIGQLLLEIRDNERLR
jgi:hypothetical protein